MNTQTITIDFPSDIFLALNETEQEITQRIKIELAIRLYKLGKLTIGKLLRSLACRGCSLKQLYQSMKFQFQT